jgi:hypothetical protein
VNLVSDADSKKDETICSRPDADYVPLLLISPILNSRSFGDLGMKDRWTKIVGDCTLRRKNVSVTEGPNVKRFDYIQI